MIFFKWWSWFKFNNLGFELVMTLKFYSSESKGLNLKLKKILGLIFTFGEVTGEKLVGRIFLLEMICSKSRNQLSIESMENLCFMVVLHFPVKTVLHYKHKILKSLYNQNSCSYLCLMEWLEGGAVSMTTMEGWPI